MASDRPRVVVAMTTCDGERFLGRQLDSIAAQSQQPDAMVVADDASRDRTLSILEEFRRAVTFPVSILGGDTRQGIHRNADRAMRRAAELGDVVVPTDHDDLWDEAKVEAIVEAFRSDPRLVLWFSDAELIDESDARIGVTLSEYVSLDDRTIDEISAGGGLRRLSHGWTISGGTTAVRSFVVPHALPSPRLLLGRQPAFHPDGWLVIIARLLGEFVSDDRPLLLYRRHADQLSHPDPEVPQSMQTKVLRRRYLLDERAKVGLVAERIRRDPNAEWVVDRRNEMLALDRFLGVRAMTRGKSGRWRAVAREYGRGSYDRFARGLRTAVFDVLNPPTDPDDVSR